MECWKEQAKKAGLTLSDYARHQLDRLPIVRSRSDPELIRNLARIGNNLNQIARWANTHKSRAESISILSALARLESALTEPGRDD